MLKCKLVEGRDCRFSERLKHEPNMQDCFCCFSMVFRVISIDLIRIIADIGAGHLSEEFMEVFREFNDYEAGQKVFVEKCYPEVVEEAKKNAVILAPFGVPLPKEIEQALRKYLNKPGVGDGVV